MAFEISTVRKFNLLLIGSSLAALTTLAIAAPASAQTAAADASATPTVAQDKSVEAIVVTGQRTIAGGLMKQQTSPEVTSSVTSVAIATKPAAGIPLQLVNTLPGVNFGQSSPLGLSGRNFLSVRGLDQGEMGWVIEGMPGSDQSQNFPQTQNWADNENIADLTLISGTTRLHDPVSTASGGEVVETLRDPGETIGGMASVSAGSYGGQRYFGRLDSGVMGNTGLSGYASLSYTQGRNFILPEAGTRLHTDVKLKKDWGGVGTSKFYFNYTKLKNVNMNSVTQAQFNTAKAADNFYLGNYQSTYTPGTTTYYKTANFQYQTWMMSLQNAFALTDKLSLHVTPYYTQRWADTGAMAQLNVNSIYNGNQKVTINPATVTLNSNGTTFPVRDNTRDRAYSFGVNTVLQWNPIATNTLRVGYWYDRYSLNDNRTELLVNGAGDYSQTPLTSTTGAVVMPQSYLVVQTINDFNIADTQTLFDDRLQLNAGVKLQWTKAEGDNRVPGAPANYKGSQYVTLPRASVLFKLTGSTQVYANVTTNTKPPIVKSSYPTTYTVSTGAVAQVGNSNLSGEYATGEEIGFRHYGVINVDVALFHMYLKNHQVSSAVVVNNLIIPTAINTGAESMHGATVEVSTKRIFGFSPYANAQYLKTRQENDQPINGTFLPTQGLAMVMSPKWVVNAGLNYDHGGLFGSLSMKYVSSQYATFMNDETMPAYAVLEASIGYRLKQLGPLKEPMIRLNFSNLNKGAYLGTVAGLQGNAIATRARDGTLIAGKSPNYYLSQPFTMMGSISVKF